MDLIHREAIKLTQDAIVEMYEIDLTPLGLDIVRFSPTGPVSFGGVEYQSIPIEVSGFQWSSEGTMPRPTMKLVAPNLNFLQLLVDFNDLVGMEVKRIKTFRKFLDDGESPSPSTMFPVEAYLINQKTAQTALLLEFTLSSRLDLESMKLPRKLILRDACVQNYRVFRGGGFSYENVTCPYTGNNYFEADGTPTSDPRNDVCGKKLKDCKRRFGDDPTVTLPMLAFPGVRRR